MGLKIKKVGKEYAVVKPFSSNGDIGEDLFGLYDTEAGAKKKMKKLQERGY